MGASSEPNPTRLQRNLKAVPVASAVPCLPPLSSPWDKGWLLETLRNFQVTDEKVQTPMRRLEAWTCPKRRPLKGKGRYRYSFQYKADRDQWYPTGGTDGSPGE